MVTLHEEISLQLFTVQNPDIETFINEARAHFEISSGNFYMSKYDMMVRADEAPYNERRVLQLFDERRPEARQRNSFSCRTSVPFRPVSLGSLTVYVV